MKTLRIFWAPVLLTAWAQASDFTRATEALELQHQGTRLFVQARFQEAEPMFRQAMEIWQQAGPTPLRGRAILAENLGNLMTVTGRYTEGETLLTGAVAELEAATGPASADVARALRDLATLQRCNGELGAAEATLRRAIGILERTPGADVSEKVYQRLTLATIYTESKRFTEAEALLQVALPDADRSQLVAIYSALTSTSIQQGQLERAGEFGRKAVTQAQEVFPKAHPALAAAYNNLAQVERFQKRYLEAEKDYLAAIEAWEQSLGRSHTSVAKGLMNLAALYHERGREAGAEALYRRSVEIFDATLGKKAPETLIARNELGEVLRAERRYHESQQLSTMTVAGLEQQLKADDPRLVRALSNQARLLSETSHTAEAAKVETRIRQVRSSVM